MKYEVTLEASGQEYAATGDTVYSALGNLPLTYLDIKTKGEIKVLSGGKTVEKLFYLRPLRMLFASHVRRAGFAKQLESLLDAEEPEKKETKVEGKEVKKRGRPKKHVS